MRSRILGVALLVALGLLVSLVPVAGVQVSAARPSAQPSPGWIREAVIYEIFPRVYSRSGDFNGITADLDRLDDLGVTVIWLMPIHPIGELRRKGTIGSPYAVRDFYAINPDYGTKEDLIRLVSEAHKRDMKVIIDIVANHTAWDSVMMKTPGFYTRDASGTIVPPVADWADVADLDYGNQELRSYMLEMLKYWIREFDLDGFRCDVAGMVPTDFWESARRELTGVKPDLLLLAEAHEPELLQEAFDLDYAWPLHHTLDRVVKGQVPASRIQEVWHEEREQFPQGSLHMRFTDNHDERRAIARFGEHGALAASALVFTMDGVPLLYNGMEVGDTAESGAPALFERIPILWSIRQRRPEFPGFYEALIDLRRRHRAFTSNDLEWLRNSDPDRIVTFVRRADGEELLVAINLSNSSFFGLVDVGSGRDFVDITPDAALRDGARRQQVPALSLRPWEFRVFRRTIAG